MWAFAIVVAVMSLFALFTTDTGVDQNRVDTSRGLALAESMATYRAAVVDMARAHPAFEGAVSEAALSLPTWWQPRAGLKAIVESRIIAVYVVTDEQDSVLQEMLRLAAGSILVGIASQSSGTLHSPSTGDTGIALPSGVPDGAPVWLATRD